MARSRITRLREADTDTAADAQIIDARFKVVGRASRISRILWRGLLAVAAAALIGFLIPPLWVLFEAIRDYFAGR